MHTYLSFRRFLLKAAVFFAGFAVLFAAAQFILRQRFTESLDLYTPMRLFLEEPADEIDVLFLGTSEMQNAILPALFYEETGLRSFNLATPNTTAISQYYLLEFILKHQTPKVIVCDFCGMHNSNNMMVAYETLNASIPDLSVRLSMVRDLVDTGRLDNPVSYFFPLLQYHGRWEQILKEGVQTKQFNENYPACLKGTHLYKGPNQDDPGTLNYEDFVPTHPMNEMYEESVGYYDRFLALCEEKGIRVFMLNSPVLRHPGHVNGEVEQMRPFLEEHGVDIINLNELDYILYLMRLDLVEDFHDITHVSYTGTEKVTRYFAQRFKELPIYETLPHGPYPSWDQTVQEYYAYAEEFKND